MNRIAAALAPLLAWTSTALAEEFTVNPDAGNNGFAAVFDDALKELNIAVSSAVECSFTYDEVTGAVSGRCAVPLATVRVDNNSTKTRHFREWITNNKSDPEACRFEAVFNGVKVGPLPLDTPVPFSAEVAITICGRGRADGGREKVTGTARLLPPSIYAGRKTVRLRAVIAVFHREAYRIGPQFTEGWPARLQSLADVVAEAGAIEFCLFAEAREPSLPAVAISPSPETQSPPAATKEWEGTR